MISFLSYLSSLITNFSFVMQVFLLFRPLNEFETSSNCYRRDREAQECQRRLCSGNYHPPSKEIGC